MPKKIQNVLLIGGSGFIGLNLAKALSGTGAKITIFCKNPKKIKNIRFYRNFSIIKGDVYDYDSVEKSIIGKDVIINFASVVSHDSSFDVINDVKTNLIGQLNILEARKKVNPNSRYIFIGSRAQFGIVDKKSFPIKENYCQNPVSLYGIHKQTAENYCHLYKRAFNLNSIVLRLPQVYGPSLTSDKTYNIINKFVKIALKNQQFKVNGYGNDIKDFIYVGDVVDLMVKILNSDVAKGTFNVGSGNKIKLIDVAKKIIKMCSSGSYKAVTFPKDIEKFELGGFYFDISKVSKQFKWKPKISLDKGIMMTINHYKKLGN